MKQFLFLCFFLPFMVGNAQAPTKRFYIEPYARPILFALMAPINIVGTNYYDTKYVRQVSSEFGINAGVRVWKNLSIGVGYNRMQIKHLLTWENYDVGGFKEVVRPGGHLAFNQASYGLKLSLKYSLPKWYFEVNISSNNPRHNPDEIVIKNLHTIIPDPNTGPNYTISENLGLGSDYFVTSIPEIIVGYSPLKNIYVQAGLKTRLHGYATPSHVKYVYQQGTYTHTLTDVTINNKCVMLSFGLSYQFWWKFKK